MTPDRRVRSLIRLAAIVVLLGLVAPSPATSYEEAGHFYSAVLLNYSRKPALDGRSRDEAALLSLCAQLPDLAKEFDAVTLRVNVAESFSGFFWGAFSRCWSRDVAYMTQIHHYLHALTGETDRNNKPVEAEQVSQAAAGTLKALLAEVDKERRDGKPFNPNLVCAAGLSVHLLGDSFAHRQRDKPTRMYPAGLGHYYDNRDPDLILFNRKEPQASRSELWTKYLDTLADALGIPRDTLPRAVIQEIVSKNMPAEPTEYNEQKIRAALSDMFKVPPGSRDFNWAPFLVRVEDITARDWWWQRHVLKRSCKEALTALYGDKLPPGYDQIDCEKIWKHYTEVAVPQFGDITPVCPMSR